MKKYSVLSTFFLFVCLMLNCGLKAIAAPPPVAYCNGATWTSPNDHNCDSNGVFMFTLNFCDTIEAVNDTVFVRFHYGNGEIDTVYPVMGPNSNFTEDVATVILYYNYHASGLFQPYIEWWGASGMPLPVSTINAMTIAVGTFCGRISGVVGMDCNSNCALNTNEEKCVNYRVRLLDTNMVVQKEQFTNNDGQYLFYYPLGQHCYIEVTPSFGQTYGSACSPSSITYNQISGYYTSQSFIMNQAANYPDLYTLLAPAVFRPGTTVVVKLETLLSSCYPNVIADTYLKLNSPGLSFAGVLPGYATPVFSGTDSVYWSGLTINRNSYNPIFIQLNVDNMVQPGDPLCLEYGVLPDVANASNNVFSQCYSATQSLNGNYKSVYPQGYTSQGLIPDNTTLYYTLNFQNAAGIAVDNPVITDTLSNMLDWSTFELLSTSHAITSLTLQDGVLKFILLNSVLSDTVSYYPSSYGAITYKINTVPGIAPGSVIENRAYYNFDQQPLIATNTTLNTIENLVTAHETTILPTRLHPNPSAGKLYLTGNLDYNSFLVVDVFGRQVLKGPFKQILDTNELPAGLYILKLNGNSMEQAIRFVKQ